MEKMLDGQVAVVFGGSGMIGRFICKILADNGAKVAVHYNSRSSVADQVVAEIKNEGGEAIALKADVNSEDSIATLLKTVNDQYGRIDICISSVHRQFIPEFIVDMTWEYWNIHIEALRAHMFICKHVVPYMSAHKYGRIVYISGGMCRRFYKGGAAYSTIKAGLNAFCKTLAMEVGLDNIMVNVVAPGRVVDDTGNITSERPDALNGTAEEEPPCENPTGRYANQKDVARSVLWFASPACDNITGQTLYVSGGELMPMP